MFKRWYYGVWLLLVIVAIVMIVSLTNVRRKDRRQFDELVKLSKPQEEFAESYSGAQQRNDVVKDIWYIEENTSTRLHFRIVSDSSELIFQNHDDGSEVIEHMNNIRCYMQEKLYYILPDGKEIVSSKMGKWYLIDKNPNDPSSWINPRSRDLQPMQQLRYIEAKQATYYYTNGTFVADKVQLSRYVLPGHQIVESLTHVKPLMRGVAQMVEFCLKGQDLNFKARDFKAVFYSLEEGIW